MGGLYSKSCRGSKSSSTVFGSPDLEIAILTRSWWLNMVAQLFVYVQEPYRRRARSLLSKCTPNAPARRQITEYYS